MLTLNRDKTEIVVFSKNGESKIEQFHYNGIFIEPKTSCRYLGIMIDNNLNFDIQLNKTLTKMANSRTLQYFPKNKCHSKWSDRSLIRIFSRRWNNSPIEIRKEKTKNKFKEKLSSEMVKLHERVPIDRQVRGFRKFEIFLLKYKDQTIHIFTRRFWKCKYLTKRSCCGYNFKFTFLKFKKKYILSDCIPRTLKLKSTLEVIEIHA